MMLLPQIPFNGTVLSTHLSSRLLGIFDLSFTSSFTLPIPSFHIIS